LDEAPNLRELPIQGNKKEYLESQQGMLYEGVHMGRWKLF
jgi:hypothetical protein